VSLDVGEINESFVVSLAIVYNKLVGSKSLKALDGIFKIVRCVEKEFPIFFF